MILTADRQDVFHSQIVHEMRNIERLLASIHRDLQALNKHIFIGQVEPVEETEKGNPETEQV